MPPLPRRDPILANAAAQRLQLLLRRLALGDGGLRGRRRLVQGDVRTATHIELAAKAVVVGNVYYNLIEMVMGSEVNGNLRHIGSNQSDTKLIGADRNKLLFDRSSKRSPLKQS